MRVSTGRLILAFILTTFGSSAAAQTARPVYLYSLESSGIGHGPLHAFSVNTSTGALLEIAGSPYSVGLIPTQIVVDPTGRFVYVTNSGSDDISAFVVDPNSGNLISMPGMPFPTGTDPVALTVDPTGQFLYVSSTAQNEMGVATDIFIYTIDSATGVLTAVIGSPIPEANSTPSVAFAPNGNYVFLTQEQGNPIAGLIDGFNFSNGLLAKVGNFGTASEFAYQAEMDPTGRFLYTLPAGNFNVGSISAYTFDTTKLSTTEIAGSPYSTGLFPNHLAFDPTGKFIYVTTCDNVCNTTNGFVNGLISAFAIDSETGALNPISGSPFSAGMNANSVVVDPTSHFAYAASLTPADTTQGFATILGYAVDSSTGVLTNLAGTPWSDSLLGSAGNQLAISYGPTGSTSPLPMIASLSPASVTAGAAGFTIQVNGANFVQGSIVYFDGQARTTTFLNSTQLTANVLSGDVTTGGTALVFVFNPLPGSGASTSIGFAVSNPSPVISTINPTSVLAGSAFSLTVNGSNFVASSTVNFNGAARSTTFVSATQLSAPILATDVASPGAATITVTNPANGVAGGGTSSPIALAILPNNTQPTVGTLIPASTTAGGPAFTLTITGSGFVQTSQISFGLNNVVTTFVSTAELEAVIPAGAIALVGNPFVIVTNPGGIISVVSTFAVNNPSPGSASVSPPSISAGTGALTLSITGQNFVQGSVVSVNGSARSTTFLSVTMLQAALLPVDLSHGGTLNITVTNPAPGGGTSTALSFAVSDFTVSLSAAPTSIAAGQPATFSLTVAPSNGAFTNPVVFSMSGLPAGASGSFSPSATITPGASMQTVTLAISTSARSATVFHTLSRWPRMSRPLLYGILVIVLFLTVKRRWCETRNVRLAPQIALGLLLAATAGLIACAGAGGGTPSSALSQGNSSGTPAGTYTITVTATSGGAVHTSTVNLTVT